MIIVNNTRPSEDEKELMNIYNDIYQYWNLFGSDGFSGNISLKYMPLNKGYFETPYWLINKINYILNIINKCVQEKEKLNKK